MNKTKPKTKAISKRKNSTPSAAISKSMAGLDRSLFMSSPRMNNVSIQDIEDQPYKYHWLVYILNNTIARNISGRLIKRLKDTVTDEYIADDKYGVKRVLQRPNTFMTLTTLIEATVLYLGLPSKQSSSRTGGGGQVFWVCLKNGEPVDLARGEVPDHIFPYNDEFISPVVSRGGIFSGWKWELPGISESAMTFKPNEIIRIYNFNPYNVLKGLSSYYPSLLTITNDIQSELWNSRLYENDAMPLGLLSTPEILDKDMRKELLNSWYEQYGGPNNARRVAMLSGGLQFQAMSLQPKDMEWSEQKKRVDEILTGTAQLNKIARGNIESINRATITEGRRILWEDTYLPIDEKILEAVNTQWVRFVDKDLELVSDISKVRVLQPKYEEKSKALVDITSTGIPVSMASRWLNLPITDDDIKNYPWLDEMPANATKAPLSLLSAKDSVEKSIVTKSSSGYSQEEIARISDAYIERVLVPGEKKLVVAMHTFFDDIRNQMLDKVDAWSKDIGKSKAAIQDGDDSISIDPEVFMISPLLAFNNLEKIYKPILAGQIRREVDKIKEELPNLIEFNVTPDMIDTYALKRRKYLREINRLTFTKVREKVSDAILGAVETNATPGEAAKLVKDAIRGVSDMRKNQSRTIARTEIGSISSDVRYDGFKEAGVNNVQWVNANDEKVRTTHADGSGDGGMIVPFGTRFPNTNLRFPLDSTGGDPGEVINCRCSIVMVETPEG